MKNDDEVIRIPDGIPAIINPDAYQMDVEKMKANKRAPGSYKLKELYLLSSLIVCGVCLQFRRHDFTMLGNFDTAAETSKNTLPKVAAT